MNGEANFLFVNRENRWDGFHRSGLSIGPDGALRLESLPRLEGVLPPQLATLPVPSAPAGVALGRDGALYFTDPDTNRLLWRSGCTPDATPAPIPCAGGAGNLPTQFQRPRGLLFHPLRNALLVVDSDNHRIQAFDPDTCQLIGIWGSEGAASGCFQTPWTLASDIEGNIYVVDYGNKRVQKFNLAGDVMPDFWDAVQTSIAENQLQLTTPSDVAAGTAADGQIRIYIVDNAAKAIFAFTGDGAYSHQFGSGVLQNPMGIVAIAGDVLVGDNPPGGSGRVLQFEAGGGFTGTAAGYAGGIAALCTGPKDSLWINSGGGNTPLSLALKDGFARSGFLWGGPFHNPSRYPREWHSFKASALLPTSNAHIRFFIFASVNGQPPPGLGDAPPWKNSQADISLSFAAGKPAAVWMAVTQDATEGMIPAGHAHPESMGQPTHVNDVWIGAELSGDGLSSPALAQIRIDFDRETLLSHLPAIYSKNSTPRRFLGRWLTLFESVFQDVEHEISGLRKLFDPAAMRPEWLDWLGQWLAVDLDDNWSDARKRQMIAQAFEVYRRRGTAEGLREALARFAGVEARVEEPILGAACWSLPPESGASALESGGSVLGITTMLAPAQPGGAVAGTTAVLDQSKLIGEEDFGAPLFDDVAYQFSLSVYRGQVSDDQKLKAVRTIIEREKPAYAAYRLCVIEPEMRVGFQSRVGIDTVIAGPAAPTGLGQTPPSGVALVLGGPLPGRLDGRTRVGKTSRLSDAAVEGSTLPFKNTQSGGF